MIGLEPQTETKDGVLSSLSLLNAKNLACWSGGVWSGRAPAEGASGVAIDTRALQPGELFVALPGSRSDGHSFVGEAFARGAVAALVQAGRLPDAPQSGPLLVVNDPEAALRRLAAGLRAVHPATFVGITGSVGKTTVKELLASMLETEGPTARTPGNWNNAIGLPLSLLRLHRLHRFGVFELGMNRPGEIGPLSDLLCPHHAVMTPIGPAHLEAFGSVQGIAEEKANLLSRVPADGMAVLWRDDRWFDLLRDACACNVRTVSLGEPGADWIGQAVGREGLRILEVERGEEVELPCPVPGAFFQVDLLLAAAMARGLGVDWAQIARAVETYTPVGPRWQTETQAGILFVNDAYNANPTSMAAALRAFGEMPVRGRRWLVLGTMRELGEGSHKFHLEIGRKAAAVPGAYFLATGTQAEAMAEGARAAGLPEDRLVICADAEAAAHRLLQEASRGDAVLLKASRGDALDQVLTIWKQGMSGA